MAVQGEPAVELREGTRGALALPPVEDGDSLAGAAAPPEVAAALPLSPPLD